MWDDLWVNGRLATMTAGGAAYGAIEDGAIAAAEGPHRLGRPAARSAGIAGKARPPCP